MRKGGQVGMLQGEMAGIRVAPLRPISQAATKVHAPSRGMNQS